MKVAIIREIYMYSYPTGESLDGLITHSDVMILYNYYDRPMVGGAAI
jgi:hypothetical protein